MLLFTQYKTRRFLQSILRSLTPLQLR